MGNSIATRIDFNHAVWGVQCIHPRYDLRSTYECVLVDSSALLSELGQQRIENLRAMGIGVYTTKGIYAEVEEAQKHEGTQRASGEERRRALSIVTRIQEEGHVVDVKTSGNQLFDFENRRVLYALSSAMTKSLLHEAYVREFGAIYRNVELLHQYYEERARRIGKTAYFIDIENGATGQRDLSRAESFVRRAFEALEEIGRRVERELPKDIEARLREVERGIEGKLDTAHYLEIRRSSGRTQVLDTAYSFKRMIRFILQQRENGIREENTLRNKYQTEKENKRSTDRKIVLAAYAHLPSPRIRGRKIGIVTADRDQPELLLLRKCASIDYDTIHQRRASPN